MRDAKGWFSKWIPIFKWWPIRGPWDHGSECTDEESNVRPGFFTIALCAVLLGGCVTAFSPSQGASIAVTCQAYASSLRAVAPYAGRMKASEVRAVDIAVGLLGPVCRGVADGSIKNTAETGITLAEVLADLMIVRNKWTR